MLQDKEKEVQAQREAEETKKEFQELKRQQERNSRELQMIIESLGLLIARSGNLDFKDIKWPLIHVLEYYDDNKADGAGLSVTRNILKRWGKDRERKEKRE
jgi:hypothetical protein